MESTEQSPDRPTPDEGGGEGAPGSGDVPQPAALPSDEPAEGDAREGDDEHDGAQQPDEQSD